MPHPKNKQPVLWNTARSAFLKLATGGDWAINQTPATRRNLVWFWLDGFFASAGDNIVGTYLVVYLISLGATQAQIGLMSSFSSLSAALLLLPGAMLVERIGRRRGIVLVGGGWARVALLLLALSPLVFQGPGLITLAIAIAITRDAMGNLAYPAWMAMTADIIPLEGRGRYFASRNFIMGISGIIVTFLVGLLITNTRAPLGYQVSLFLAFAIGSLSVFSFSRLQDAPRPAPSRILDAAPVSEPQPVPRKPGLGDALRRMFSHGEFVRFAAVTALWNFSLNIAGPFFSVYLVKDLHASATMIGLTTIASSVASMLAQRKLGELHDRWGARKLVTISGLLIPILPLMWVFINAAWQVIPANLASGALWGAYNLAAFNYLLVITPVELRARYSAIFQVIVTLSLASGAAVGSLIITHWGYDAVFIGSGSGRLLAALLFVLITSPRLPHPRLPKIIRSRRAAN